MDMFKMRDRLGAVGRLSVFPKRVRQMFDWYAPVRKKRRVIMDRADSKGRIWTTKEPVHVRKNRGCY